MIAIIITIDINVTGMFLRSCLAIQAQVYIGCVIELVAGFGHDELRFSVGAEEPMGPSPLQSTDCLDTKVAKLTSRTRRIVNSQLTTLSRKP